MLWLWAPCYCNPCDYGGPVVIASFTVAGHSLVHLPSTSRKEIHSRRRRFTVYVVIQRNLPRKICHSIAEIANISVCDWFSSLPRRLTLKSCSYWMPTCIRIWYGSFVLTSSNKNELRLLRCYNRLALVGRIFWLSSATLEVSKTCFCTGGVQFLLLTRNFVKNAQSYCMTFSCLIT